MGNCETILLMDIVYEQTHEDRKRGRNHDVWACSQLKVAKMSVLASPCLSFRFFSCNNSRTSEQIHEILYCRVLLKSRHIQSWLESDCYRGHFTWRPTCVSACGSDWMGNPQAILITMVTWGIPILPDFLCAFKTFDTFCIPFVLRSVFYYFQRVCICY
jgi:hypothetical protein